MHLYESHMGGYYVEEEYNQGFLETCPSCGDYDMYVGEYDTMEEVALVMYKENIIDEHIAEVTGLKVNVSFEKVEEQTLIT